MATIETLEDWNDRLEMCGCCPMPACPIPTQECQSLSASNTYAGFGPVQPPGGDPQDKVATLWALKDFPSWTTETGTMWSYDSGPGTAPFSAEQQQTITVDRDTRNTPADSGSATHTGNVWDGSTCTGISGDGYFHDFSPIDYGTPVVTTDCAPDHYTISETYTSVNGSGPFSLVGCPGPFSADSKEAWNLTKVDNAGVQLSDPKTESALITETIADIPDTWPSPATGSACDAITTSDWPHIGDADPWPACSEQDPPIFTVHCSARKTRFRWVIPDAFAGSYFKVTWDILEEPDGWDSGELGAPARSFVSEDQTWVWSGPGDPETPSTWRSPWFEIAPPSIPGTRSVVNIRFECYHGPYGTKPQVTGRAVSLLDP